MTHLKKCPVCGVVISENKDRKTCSAACAKEMKQQSRRQHKKRCPICKLIYLSYEDQPVCTAWECQMAKRKCKDWAIPLERFTEEVNARNLAQQLIDRQIGLNQIHLPEITIRIMEV